MDEIILKRIADYCKGEISKEDFEKLGEWLSENPDNRAVLKSYVELYKKGREISFLENWDREASWQRLSRRLENSRKERAGRLRRLVRRFAATAAACLLFVGGVYYFYDNREVEKRPYGLAMIQPGSTKAVLELPNGSEIALEDTSAFYMQEQGTVVRQDSGRTLVYEKRGAQEKAVYHTLRVPVGGEYHLVLSDGTRVWLNANTELEFPVSFVRDERVVRLKGEAYFEVARDERKPFIVKTAGMTTRVLGTAFNIKAYADERDERATLLEGRVEVALSSSPQGKTRTVLEPGMQARWRAGSRSLSVQAVNSADVVAWRRGEFVFNEEDISVVLQTLSRWYGVEFVAASGGMETYTFSGMMSKDDKLEDILEVLTMAGGPSFRVEGDKIYMDKNKSRL